LEFGAWDLFSLVLTSNQQLPFEPVTSSEQQAAAVSDN
jgi:hypothetical protein